MFGTIIHALIAALPLAANDNILIVIADDLGTELVGAYADGHTPARTPRIDELAENGLLFRNAWGYPRCSPTRATVLTGRWGFHTGIGENVNDDGFNWPVPLEEQTIPETLSATHASAAFGKWHMGNVWNGGDLAPNLAGYDHFSGTLGLLREPEEWFEYDKIVDGETMHVENYRATEIVDDALDWLTTAPQPWLVSVNFNNPHPPVHDPPAHLHSYGLPLVGFDAKKHAMVEAMDTELGRLLDTIDFAVTTVIFLGDNGTTAKGTLYETSINVPFIVAGAAVTDPGREVSGLVHTVDVHATVARIAGVNVQPYGLDSISFAPHLDNEPPGSPAMQRARRFSFSERFKPNGLGPTYATHRTVRNMRYKLIRRPDHDELYNLGVDPAEQVDLLAEPGGLPPAAEAQYLLLAAELQKILDS